MWDERINADFGGSIYFRPANLYAASKAMLDMNRLSEEVGAISQAPAKVALLYSIPSVFWQPDYLRVTTAAYASLSFLGQPVTFISERQLADGLRSPANEGVRWIVLPRATHIGDAALKGLEAFAKSGGRIIRLGDDTALFDEYDSQRSSPDFLKDANALSWSAGDMESALFAPLAGLLEQSGMRPEVHVVSADTGGPLWGVQYRYVEHEGHRLLSVINLLKKEVRVRIVGAQPKAVDLISGRQVDTGMLTLGSAEPLLLRLAP